MKNLYKKTYLKIHNLKFLLKFSFSSKILIYKGEKEEDGIWFECNIKMTDMQIKASANPSEYISNQIKFNLKMRLLDELEVIEA